MELPGPHAEILDSWKEISRYLSRDIRTLQRWEHTRGLPVRRAPGGAKPGVYALKSELDSWRRTRSIHVTSAEDVPPAARKPSVAVLPFLNLSSSTEDQYFGDGLADEVITALSRLPGLKVTARTSSFAFRGPKQDIHEIGRRLKAQAVLEGSVRRSGNRIRVTAQLVEAEQGYHLWSERFDRELTDVFAIQDDIARAIVEALRVKLACSSPRVAPPTRNMEAYHLWLRGRYHTLRQTPSEISRSRDFFQQAIAIDPSFAPAHLGLAESWWEGAFFGLDRPREAVAIGRRAVMKALESDPTLGEAQGMMGIYLGVHDFDWGAAEAAFRRGLEFASSQVRARFALWLLGPTGRCDEAREQYQLALESDPLSPVLHGWLAQHLLVFDRDLRRATEEIQLATELDPGYWWAHLMLAGIRMFEGSIDESIRICERVLEATGANPFLLGSMGLVYALSGARDRAETVRRELIESSRKKYVAPTSIAWIDLGLGEIEGCLDWLEKAVEEREPAIVETHAAPLYDSLRRHPRFQALLSTMRLAGRINPAHDDARGRWNPHG